MKSKTLRKKALRDAGQEGAYNNKKIDNRDKFVKHIISVAKDIRSF